ncbi:MAG: trehalose-phosphatase [Vicinamibacteria bacterium]
MPEFDPRWALFIDIDGTILDLVAHPDDAEAEPALLSTLGRIFRLNGGALALVSGRSLEGIDAIVRPLRLPAAGLHGLERRNASGVVTRVEADRTAFVPVERRFESFVGENPGSFIEDKKASLALHYRGAPEASDKAERLARDLSSEIPAGLLVQPGKMVIEVKPSGRTKGTAIAEFMAEAPFGGRMPVFLGDDLSDEDGFEWVNGKGGISIKVGPGPTEARYRLESVDAVALWLSRYRKFLAESSN